VVQKKNLVKLLQFSQVLTKIISPKMTSLQTKNQHLMWRAGFGPASSQVTQLGSVATTDLYQAIKKASLKKPSYIDVTDDYLKGFFMGVDELGKQEKRKELTPEEKRKARQQTREDLKSLNLNWLDQMVHTEGQLREKMAFFWHGHFASRNINIFYQQQLLDIIRNNALGNFKTLLHEVSKSASILNFLNAQQNRKGHPNENFAREVMELFTLGRGNYTENDIKEAARAFTGWGANAKGEFVFRKFQHDTGNKTIFGKTGNFEGEDVLDLLLEQKQTAQFITNKVYRFFVNENIDKEKTQWLSKRFYESGYDIAKLMDDIFTSSWFYEDKNIGVKIKSPIELLAGIQRILPMKLENPESLLVIQKILGQILFYPPNVSGWPGGRAWIDSSTLMMRLRIPQLLNDTDDLNVQPKSDDDQMMGMMQSKENMRNMGRAGRPVKADINWESFTEVFSLMPKEKVIGAMSSILLQTGMKLPEKIIFQYADGENKNAKIRSAALQIMSIPEYQMC
jgi:uncharacterized protein (DUF1800 family)